jgi:GNAT superfamily N-acetyltransferase
VGVEIRRAAGDDAAAVAGLRAAWLGDGEGPAFTARMAEWLASEGERRTTWLSLDGKPVGMASLFEYHRMPKPERADSRWGYVSNMFVREEHRGRGIGTALLAAVVATADERGYARLVLSPSERAIPLYVRAGFVVPDESVDGDRLLVRPAG